MYRAAYSLASKACQAVGRASKVGSRLYSEACVDAQSSPSNVKQVANATPLVNGATLCSDNYTYSAAGLLLKNLKCGSNITDGKQQDYDILSRGEDRITKLLTKSVENPDGLFLKDLKCHQLASADNSEKEGAILEKGEKRMCDHLEKYAENDISWLSPRTGEEDSNDIPNKVTMFLDGKPTDVALSFDLCMTQLRLYLCQMYASLDISEVVGYEKILSVATPRPASFYLSMKYLNKHITLIIDPFTGWLMAIVTPNYAIQFRRSLPYVRLANTVILQAKGTYGQLAPDAKYRIPIGINHLREAVVTLADSDGTETPAMLFSLAVLLHHIMEPAKIHKAYSLVHKTLSEGTETTYGSSDPSIVQLTKNLGHISRLAGQSVFNILLDQTDPPILPSRFKVEGICNIHDVFSELFLMTYSLIPKKYICSPTGLMFWCPVGPGWGDSDIRPLENFPAALQSTDGERVLDLLKIELFFGDRTGGPPCAKAFEVVRRRPPGEDASFTWRLGLPIRGRPLCDAVSLIPKLDAILRRKGI